MLSDGFHIHLEKRVIRRDKPRNKLKLREQLLTHQAILSYFKPKILPQIFKCPKVKKIKNK